MEFQPEGLHLNRMVETTIPSEPVPNKHVLTVTCCDCHNNEEGLKKYTTEMEICLMFWLDEGVNLR